MRSLNPAFLATLSLTPEQASVLRRLGEYKGKQELYSRQTPEILESLKQSAIIESSESSPRIEGAVAPHERVVALVGRSTEPRDRSEREIAGYRDALALIHESARHMELTPNVIRQIHSILYRYMPQSGGRWKATQNDIVEKDSRGTILRVRFSTLSPVATPQAMDDLTARYHEAVATERYEPLLLVPLAILDFLCIHPFTDGNGRVARLLTLMLLYHLDYQVGRFISLERIFEESKETYYETLESSSRGWHEGAHDVFPWVDYFWGVLLRAYAEFEERVGIIRTTWGSKTQQVRMAVDRRIGPFSIAQIARDCPRISRVMIKNVLGKLRDEGVISLEGRGRGARWVREMK